jgi:hypothetical protein
MSGSTAPAVKSKLVELFNTALEGEGTEVWFNRPSEDHQLAENVYVCGIQGERDWAGVGRRRPHQVEENYAVEVEVEVYRQGTDAVGPEERLWAIVDLLEEALEDPTLGNQENVQWALVRHFNQASVGSTDGWLCKVALSVAVKARI